MKGTDFGRFQALATKEEFPTVPQNHRTSSAFPIQMIPHTLAQSRMYLLYLLLVICIGLCFFMPPLVKSVCLELDDSDIDELLFYHNAIRASVEPPAANMRQLVWSNELADIAAVNACQCNFQYTDLPPIPFRQHYARENHIYYPINNLGSMVVYWYQENEYYNFFTRQCDEGAICEHYLNMVWARARGIGCALSVCSPEQIYNVGDPNLGVDGQGSQIIDRLFMLVCVYGAGFPEDANLGNQRPYRAGEPCSECPRNRYPLCFREPLATPLDLTFDFRGEQQIRQRQLPNLCHDDEEAFIGSDPHFAIRLSGGALLCYTFQGQTNTIFNLISNDQLQMNALFVPDDTAYDNTWLGSIGITIHHDGKNVTTLQFIAADQLIRIGERVEFDAKTVKKLSFQVGKLTMLEVPSNHTPRYPSVDFKFIETGLEFTIKFTKTNHLDLYWHNIRVPSQKSGGVVGQFFCDGVRIDEDAHVLHMPGRPPVPVEQQNLWKFSKQSLHDSDTKCWTSAYHSSQGAGIVAGTYQDYIVKDLLSVTQ